MRNPKSFYYDPHKDLCSYCFRLYDFQYCFNNYEKSSIFYEIDSCDIFKKRHYYVLNRLKRMYAKKML